MTPNLGQGGSQAVEDAVVLGRVLEETIDLEAGLRRYEAIRQSRANKFVDQSRKIGRLGQWNNGLVRWIRDFGMGLVPDSMTERRFVEMLDFEVWYESAVDDLMVVD